VKDVANELGGLEREEEQELREFEREMERYRKEHEVDLQHELKEHLLDFDPKQGGKYYTRFHFADLRKFDLDEECKILIDHLS
jgi:hypothetical protein